MRKFVIILGVFFSSISFANEPTFNGVYYDFPAALASKSWVGYPSNNGTLAGNGYLYQKQINSPTYISSQKDAFISTAREQAKKYAIEMGKNYYAITNLSFQVVRTESTTELYTDYYITAW